MKKLSNEIKCSINYLDSRGFGVCEIGRKKVFIINAIKGEEVFAIKFHKNYYITMKVLKESPHRNHEICSHFPKCGGCNLIHIEYNKQLELKQNLLNKLFLEENILKIIPSPKIFHYRNKMDYTFGGKDHNLDLGLVERFSFYEIINIFDCKISPPEFNKIVATVREFLSLNRYEPFDKQNGKGFLRYLILRKSFTNNQLMLNLITTEENKININELKKYLHENSIFIDSVIWSVNNRPSDVTIGEMKSFLGKPYIEEKIVKYTYRIYPNNFFQTNTFQAENMLNFIRNKIYGGGKALDLYSGVGFFSIGLSDLFDKVIGVELDSNSVKVANENKKINNVENVEFLNAAAEELSNFFNETVDYLIVDPPRSGLNKKVIRWIAKHKPPNIIYVSCNPATASRDISYIKKAGYQVVLIQPFDQFPHTPHIETISLISRKKF